MRNRLRCPVRRDFWEGGEWRPRSCMNQQRHHCLSKEGSMEDAGAKVVDLIFGRWRSQILGNFHKPRKVVNSLPGLIAGMAGRRRSSAVRQSCLQSEPIRVKRKCIRPLPRPWVAIRGRHLRWTRRPLGLIVSPMALPVHDDWIRTRA